MNKSQFFDENGLSSTSISHICNMAKEWYSNLESELSNIRLYKKDMKLISSDVITDIALETSKDNFNNIPELLNQIAQAKSLISWGREAIKQKKQWIKEIQDLSFFNWCKQKGIEEPQCPYKEDILTEEEYYNSLSIKERNRYYYLETMVSVIGKYIHPNGDYSNARKRFMDNLQNPIEIEGRGNDTIIYSYKSTYTVEEVDNMFFELQKKHREYQAELNGMKHACEIAIEKSYNDMISKYNQKYVEYQQKQRKLMDEWNQYVHDESNKIAALKIVIPNSLKPIYEKINNLGK